VLTLSIQDIDQKMMNLSMEMTSQHLAISIKRCSNFW